MGAYLYFETKSNVDSVTDYLFNKNELNKFLEKMEEQTIWLCDSEHIEWTKKERADLLDWELKKFGKGEIKTSTDMSSKMVKSGYSQSDLTEMWVQIFEELNKRFEMKYFANSCSLNPDSKYFTLEQMKRITNNGKLLSGKTAKSERARDLYKKYYKLFSIPEKIPIINEKDELLLDDGVSYKVENKWGDLKLKWLTSTSKYNNRKIEDIVDFIQGYTKYIPRIRYDGALADMESFILDGNELIFLELIGQENKVKSISSVLMQGKIKMNDHTIDSTEFGFFSIYKAGNKRKMISLKDGLAHAIIYHSPSIVDTNFSVLIGRSKDELIQSFSTWLENSQPLPYPKELIKEIYTKLQEKEKLKELNSYGIEALKVDLSILENEYADLMEIILDVCKENGLIDQNAKPIKQQFPLPKSPILQKKQVEKIWNTLNSMPKTYELEDLDIKPIGLKLFNSNMTIYVTEADKGFEDDEFENMHTQCYGYVKNESDPQMSEWGYINIADYITTGNKLNYFEQDLYFEDMYIDSKGNVSSLENLQNFSRKTA